MFSVLIPTVLAEEQLLESGCMQSHAIPLKIIRMLLRTT